LVCEEDESMMEDLVVSGIAITRDEARFVVRSVPDKPGVAAKIFKPLAEAGVVVDVIVQTPSHDGYTDLAFTVGRLDVERTREAMKKTQQELKIGRVELEEGIAKVSIVGVGMRNHAGVASKMFEVLAGEGVNIRVISTSEIKVSCLIDEKYAELAVRALHTAFGLDKPAR
jgi:aspartate kinase